MQIRQATADNVKGKKVLVRVDLNVPMKDGVVTDKTRIERIIPTIKTLLDQGGKVILASHFGRPKGQRQKDMSLQPLVAPLAACLGGPVAFASDCVGEAANTAAAALEDGQVLLLENLRFHPEEEKNDLSFAKQLAALADLYVGDAFSCSHRAHASTAGITDFLPSFAGPLMMAEIEALTQAVEAPERPTAALVGGAKVSSKLAVLKNLIAKTDLLVIGGGMANTFLYAQGKEIGASLCEKDLADTAKDILAEAEKVGCKILLPTDVVVAEKFAEGATATVVSSEAVPADKMILDVGPESIAAIKDQIAGCKTLLWNGPMGAFEIEPFHKGTVEVAQAAAERSQAGQLVTVGGGGDTVAALNLATVAEKFTYVSTAGGAFLEWLEGRDLPGVAALKKAAA